MKFSVSSVITSICSFKSLFLACYRNICVILLYLLASSLWSCLQSPKMARATKNSANVMDTSVNQETSMISQDSSSSDQEMEVQISQCFPQSTSHHNLLYNQMFMPYIEGPKMDWTVNDSLYYRFLKWRLKCENILDWELAMLPEAKKYKKVIAWNGDFGKDQYDKDLSLKGI